MKTFEWGRYAAQFADFTLIQIRGRSLVHDGCTSQTSTTSLTNSESAFECMQQPSGEPSNWCKKGLLQVDVSDIRQQLGSSPTIISCLFRAWRGAVGTQTYSVNSRLYRLFPTGLDLTDATYRYKDASALTTWYSDGYSPAPAQDFVEAYVATHYHPAYSSIPTDYDTNFDITDEMKYALLANTNLLLLWKLVEWPTDSQARVATFCWNTTGKNPYLVIRYLMPFEFHRALDDGTIDIANPLDPALDLAGSLDLGAYERGQTGSAVKAFVRNYSQFAVASAEVWDDAAEYDPYPPAKIATGGGTGTLDYVSLAEAAVSQHYFFKFSTATHVQVKALAYRDNLTNLNSGYGGGSWEFDITGDWNAPSGGLTIPSAAWTGTFATGDEFETYVVGNSTDSGWPADSNDQIEMTLDSTGSPDNNNWRPITGRRTFSTASVTIDAAQKTVSVKHIDTSKWPTDNRIFITDGTNTDHGHIDSVSASSITITFDSVTNHVFASGSKVCTTLPLGAISAGVWGLTTQACGDSQPNPNRIYLADTSGYSASDKVLIQDATDSDTAEVMTVLSVATTYLTTSADMTLDYPAGAFVAKKGSGEKAFWLRVKSTAVTIQELKRARLNVRT